MADSNNEASDSVSESSGSLALGNNPSVSTRTQVDETARSQDIVRKIEILVPFKMTELGGRLQPVSKCSICREKGKSMAFLKERQLLDHIKERHKEYEIEIRCVCGRPWRSLQQWHVHKIKCKGEPTTPTPEAFQCSLCTLSFKTKSGLGQHERHRHAALRNEKREKQNIGHSLPGVNKGGRKCSVWDAHSTNLLTQLKEKLKGDKAMVEKIVKELSKRNIIRTRRQVSDKLYRMSTVSNLRRSESTISGSSDQTETSTSLSTEVDPQEITDKSREESSPVPPEIPTMAEALEQTNLAPLSLDHLGESILSTTVLAETSIIDEEAPLDRGPVVLVNLTLDVPSEEALVEPTNGDLEERGFTNWKQNMVNYVNSKNMNNDNIYENYANKIRQTWNDRRGNSEDMRVYINTFINSEFLPLIKNFGKIEKEEGTVTTTKNSAVGDLKRGTPKIFRYANFRKQYESKSSQNGPSKEKSWSERCSEREDSTIRREKKRTRGRPMSSRQKKVHAFARCQEMYKNCPKKLAEFTVKGDFSFTESKADLPMKREINNVYSNLWGQKGPEILNIEMNTMEPTSMIDYIHPITAQDIKQKIKVIKNDSAPGADGIKKKLT
uniref:Bcl6 protein n=1 Tax=Fopius arisanus TaxID=64838 RepID=A0A0C9RDJ6_9HYME